MIRRLLFRRPIAATVTIMSLAVKTYVNKQDKHDAMVSAIVHQNVQVDKPTQRAAA